MTAWKLFRSPFVISIFNAKIWFYNSCISSNLFHKIYQVILQKYFINQLIEAIKPIHYFHVIENNKNDRSIYFIVMSIKCYLFFLFDIYTFTGYKYPGITFITGVSFIDNDSFYCKIFRMNSFRLCLTSEGRIRNSQENMSLSDSL